MPPHPPDNSANNSTQGELTCCACNKLLDGDGMRFPKSPQLKSAWVDIIIAQSPDYPGKREKLQGLGLHLCIKHFDPSMLIKKMENGHTTYALKKGGVPTIFNNIEEDGTEVMDVDSTTHGDDEISICYETIANTADAKPLEETDPDIVPVDEITNSAAANGSSVSADVFSESEMLTSTEPVSKTDLIESLQDFVSSLKLKDDKYYQPWRVMYNESSVLFSLFDADCKYLIQSFTVDENLTVSVYYHGQAYTDSALTELLGQEVKLDTWTKFKKLVLLLHTVTNEKQHLTLQLKHACHLINNCIETGPQFGCTPTDIKKWIFLLDQLQISNGESGDFSAENLQWAVQTYSVNRQGYLQIYKSDVLTLPHPATLEMFRRQAQQQASRLPQAQQQASRLPQTPVRLQQQVNRQQQLGVGRRKPEPVLAVGQKMPQRPGVSGVGNGLNPPNQLKLVSPNTRMMTHGSLKISPAQNGFSSNGSAVEEIEIAE